MPRPRRFAQFLAAPFVEARLLAKPPCFAGVWSPECESVWAPSLLLLREAAIAMRAIGEPFAEVPDFPGLARIERDGRQRRAIAGKSSASRPPLRL
jgi:hypothetical protein